MIQAGFGQRTITPALGAEMPGGINKRFSQGVHDALLANAMVLDDGTTQLVLVGIDALSVKRSITLKARKRIEDATGIPAGNVMIAASHTHNGGPIADVFMSESDPAYCDFVAEQIAQAAIEGYAKREEVTLIIGAGQEGSVAFNRRFRMKDGAERTHPGKGNPDIVRVAGPIDPMVGVIGAANKACTFLGCWVNYSCHATLGVGGNGFSADYIYYLRQTIQRAMGTDNAIIVFGNGASGDVTQVDNLSNRESEFGEHWGWHVGTTVGAEVIKVLARMNYTDALTLACASQTLELRLRALDNESLNQAQAWGDQTAWKRELELLKEIKKIEPQVTAEVQMMRIGSVGLIAVPAEYFCHYGLEIKANSPLDPTFVVSLANGCIGYVPTPQAFVGGGYEPRTARSSKLCPDAGERIAAAAIGLLHRG
ncbi:hypothetical protein HYR99_37315 [Candidatus Poribacteria bacterium]|nr:hypothetical protein [Candidatus Poribacteria bacterium]